MPIRRVATKTLGRSIGGKFPTKPSVIDGDGDGFSTGVDGKDNVPVVELIKDSFSAAEKAFRSNGEMPERLPVPESWFENKTTREQVKKNFPNFHYRWDEKSKRYIPSTGLLGKNADGYDKYQDTELASLYVSHKYWHPSIVQSDSPVAQIMRAWRSSFAESRAYTQALGGMDVAKNFDSEKFREETETLRKALDNASPLKMKSYRVARLTTDVGKSTNVGDELNFSAAAVAFEPSNAQAFELDELSGPRMPSKYMFEFPDDTKGLIFDEAGERAAGRESAKGGDKYPQEAIVSGKFQIARIEQREITNPLNPREKIVRDVYVLEAVSTKSLGRPIGIGRDASMFDGDGDGFITNPLTGEDDIPAPAAAIETVARTLSKGSEKFESRFKEKYKQDVPNGDGDCFVAGYKLLEEMTLAEADPEKRKRIRLVHGSPFGTGGDALGRRFPHSWVEVDDNPTDAEKKAMLKSLSKKDKESLKTLWERMPEMNVTVYDYSNGRKIVVPAAVYYGLGNIDKSENRHYTLDEAIDQSNKVGHYGPWE